MTTTQKRTFRPIALLTGAEFWGAIGLQIALFVAPLIALEIFDATPMHIAALNLTESAAALVFGLAVAGFVGKLGGARAITFANALRVLSCTIVAVSLYTQPSLWILFLALFLLGIASLLNEAGVNTAVVEFVGRDGKSLNRANSLLRTSGVLSELGGIGLGGLVVSLLTFATTMWVGSFSFAVALVLSLMVWLAAPTKARPAPEPCETDTVRPSFNGLRFIWNNDFLKRLTLTSFHFNFFSSIFQAVFIIYCVRVLDFEPWALAVVGVAGGIGGLVGAALASTHHWHNGYVESMHNRMSDELFEDNIFYDINDAEEEGVGEFVYEGRTSFTKEYAQQ
ncbi:MFS transporter [Corynebacterium phocae]|uniref:MFS transporter n=1 Tax=Corynebacterium phocae TaxID=161895 RepID=UPI000952E97C|nr:MFS transporter [Corynebacterium phocae]